MNREEAYALVVRERGVRNRCAGCGGLGFRLYGDSSTWSTRDGMAAQSCTHDICDDCWGSGEQGQPWRNLAALEVQAYAKRSLDAQTAVAEHMGMGLGMLRQHLDALALILEKETRRRKTPEGIDQKDEFWWHRTLDYFVAVFRSWGASSARVSQKG